MKWQDIGDLELDDNGEPKWAGYQKLIYAKRAVLIKSRFTACSLQPQGSRWQQNPIARATGNRCATIDPAVLFIDRCLQLLKTRRPPVIAARWYFM